LKLKTFIEKGLIVIFTALIGGGITYIASIGKHGRAIEMIGVENRTQAEKILDLDRRTIELQKSRETLSDTYVTRREFNRIVEEQKTTLEKIDSKLERLVERMYNN
jgi:hypothetical protein